MRARLTLLFLWLGCQEAWANSQLLPTPTPAQAVCTTPLRTVPNDQLSCSNQWLIGLFSELGCQVKFMHAGATWPRRLRLLSDGQIDFLLGVTETPERRQTLVFTLPIVQHRLLLLTRTDTPEWHAINHWCDDTQRRAHILIPAQGHYGDKVEQLRRRGQCAARVTAASQSSDQAFKMLMAGRADLMIATSSWWLSLNEQQKAALHTIDVDIWHEDSGIATRNLPDDLMGKINQVIQKKLAAGDTPCNMPAVDLTAPRVN